MNEENQENGTQAITNFGHNSSLLQNLINRRHTPDILDCIANLSNDEVFTPPALADKVLDLLPEEVWHDKNLKWLDPACKTGIFLRQIAKRLMEGLREDFPDEEERRQHIFQNMLYGLPITSLTALMTRRSLYTSKDANSKKSIAKFGLGDGNIYFANRDHVFNNNGICKFCGVSQNNKLGQREADGTLENHAYSFIHGKPNEIIQEIFNKTNHHMKAEDMKFDVIVGNPPYQFNYGTEGKNDSKAFPIYQLFIEQAMKLNPRYMSFIVPSKWALGTKELFAFQEKFINDHRISTYYDFIDSGDLFPGVTLEGICYFVWDREKTNPDVDIYVYQDAETLLEHSHRPLNNGSGTFVRMSTGDNIVKKCLNNLAITSRMDELVTGRAIFGISGSLIKDKSKSENAYFYENLDAISKANPREVIPIYSLNHTKSAERFKWYYVDADAPFLKKTNLEKWKLCFPKSVGESIYRRTWVCPPGKIFTDTWLNVFVESEEQAKNLNTYFQTYIFRYLLLICCATRNVYRQCYRLIPDLSKTLNERTGEIGWDSDWVDEDLQKIFGFTDDEIEFAKKQVEHADGKETK